MAQKKVNALEEKLGYIQEEWQKEIDFVKEDTQRLPALEGRLGSIEKCVEAVLEKLSSSKKHGLNNSTSANPRKQKLDEIGASSPRAVGEAQGDKESDLRRAECRPTCQLEFSIFSGVDPDGWLFRVERYFNLNQLTKTEKLELMAVAMEGRALAWFQYAEEGRKFTSWRRFKEVFLTRFLPKHEGSLCEKFLASCQLTTVDEYPENIELLEALLQGRLSEEVLESTFLNELKLVIWAEVRMMRPSGLTKIMDATQMVEDKNQMIQLGRIRLGNTGGSLSKQHIRASLLLKLEAWFLSSKLLSLIMHWVQLKLRCPENVNGIQMDPNPDWSFEDLLSELDELDKKLNSSVMPFVKTGTTREMPHAKRGENSKKTFVMRVSDISVDDSDSEDESLANSQSLVPANRFPCNDISISDDSEDKHGIKAQCPPMDRLGLVEGALLELNHEFQLGIKEEIRNHISELETQLLIVNEKSTSALGQVKKKAEARREMDRKIDMQYQRKMAEALDDHLTAVLRDHEHKSQIEERRIRDDAAALEEARRKEKAIQEEKLCQQKLKAEEEERRAEELRKAALDAEERAVKEAAEKMANENSARSAAVATAAAKHNQTNAAIGSQNIQSREAGPSGSDKVQSGGNMVRATENALKLEEKRQQKCKDLEEQNQALVSLSSQEFVSFERQIARRIRTITASADNIWKKAAELVGILNDPSCPQSFSIATFAKQMISLCETPGADFNNKAFACGHVIVLVTAELPNAMDIFLAKLNRACIYTVPKHVMYSKSAFETREAYFKAIGYNGESGKLESEDDFIQRLGSYMRLYGALIQTEIEGVQNLHGLEEGWSWLARVLNSLPPGVYTAVAIEAFLRMAGFALHRRYQSQFRKLLSVVARKFAEAFETREDHKTVFRGLKSYVETNEFLEEPEGWRLHGSLKSRSLRL